MNLNESLYDWISRISSPKLGPACPYALKAFMNREVILVEDGSTIPDLIPLKDGISVCVVPRIGIEYDDLGMVCEYYNQIFPEYLFLDTHPEETLRLNGNKTVWEYPAIIIQRKGELLDARSHLMKIGFYKNWDRDLLDDLGIIPDK
jgi:hypothetical protein